MIQNLKTIRRKIRDSLMYWQVLSHPEYTSLYTFKLLDKDDTADLDAAKRLHAAVYLSRGFVDHSDITEGIIHDVSDPHQHHSQYFVVKKRDEIVGLARQITYRGAGHHHESFPVLDKAILHERSRRRIMAMHPYEITEISALVKKPGESPIIPLMLYRELWRHSYRSKHRVWIMACDVRLYERLKILFGTALKKIGQRTPYPGGDVIPVVLNIAAAANYVKKVRSQRRSDILDLHKKAARFITKPSASLK